MDVNIKNRNKVILAFLNGISYEEQEMKTQLTLKTCVALEHLYGMSTKYYVAPMCFMNNIMQYQATQSRMCINLNAKTGQAGSYKTVSDWLVSQSTKELDFPQSDCMVAFDNNQVVGKSRCVSTDNKVKSSCVTSICAVAIDTGSCNFSHEQFKIANHPKTSSTTLDLYKNLIISGTRMELILTKFMIHTIRYYVTILINICPWYIKNTCLVMVMVCLETKIDQSISAKQSEQLVIICALCGSVYQKSKIKCDTCKVNLRASRKRNLPDVQVNTGKSKQVAQRATIAHLRTSIFE